MITEVLQIRDSQLMAEYREAAAPLIARHGGRFLARSEPCAKLEGDWARVAIVSFPDMAAAQHFYNSPEYTLLRQKRERAADARIIVIEGR